MNTELILQYLQQLREHNNRDWYHANQVQYRRACAEFESLVQALMRTLGGIDDRLMQYAPRELTFRLARDTRFSQDKSPYQPAFRAHIGPKGKLPIPVGYYLALKPGDQSFLGGGLFSDLFSDATARIRAAIANKPGEWEAIIRAPAFAQYFTVQGTALQRVPKGYDPQQPQAEFLKYKSWYVQYLIPDAELLDAGAFLVQALRIFDAMRPLNDFINRALEGFALPAR